MKNVDTPHFERLKGRIWGWFQVFLDKPNFENKKKS